MKTKKRYFLPLLSMLTCISCTKSCSGIPELGSEKYPIKFYISNIARKQMDYFNPIATCMESKVGFKIRFETTVDDKSVAEALNRGDAHFGYINAFEFVDAGNKYDLKPYLMRYERSSPLTRSVILGKTATWKQKLTELGLNLSKAVLKSDTSLSIINNARFVFLTPESDVGFLVPRHLLLEHDVFPNEAIFAGTYELVLQALSRNLALAGAVSEAWLSQKYINDEPVQIGSQRGEYLVLAISSPLPGKIIAGRSDLPKKTVEQVIRGLNECSTSELISTKTIFGGDSFGPINERLFSYVRELVDERDTFLRTEVIR